MFPKIPWQVIQKMEIVLLPVELAVVATAVARPPLPNYLQKHVHTISNKHAFNSVVLKTRIMSNHTFAKKS